jgi:septal ring factor EnvC (AmiA/AmiB activator)
MKRKTLCKVATILLIIGLSIPGFVKVNAQTLSEIMDTATIENQINSIHQRTRVYDNFRAIRDDVFLKMKRNVNDSLNATKLEIAHLNSNLAERNFQIETLNSDLSRTKNERDEAIRNKDSMSFIGIQMNKGLYNSILWFVILGLLVVSAVLFLLFKRAHVVTTQVKNELETMQRDFEEHKRSSREKYEKLVVSHHNEIMKLKRS